MDEARGVVPEGHVPFPREALDGSLIARFLEQAAAWPDRPAVRQHGRTVRYGELAERVDRIAGGLLSETGAGDAAVALLLPMDARTIAAVLAVLRTGRPYLCLDAEAPEALLRETVAQSEAALIVAEAEGLERARRVAPGVPVATVEELEARATGPGDFPDPGPDRPAYIFFTSGSTGRPKGVVDVHRNVLHNVLRYTNTLGIGPDDRMTLLQAPSFSGSVSSLFGALLNGACSVPLDPRGVAPSGLVRWLVDERITIYHSVPGLFRAALAGAPRLPDLRVVRLEGDQASPADLAVFRAVARPDAVLVNGLGTTETGLVCQHFVSPSDAVTASVVPVGRPVVDVRVSVVDASGEPTAPGTAGEIVVHGRYLAVGYWKDPELTAERFQADPVEPGMRSYRTGDLGRFRDDGCLEHLGRIDRRIKIRGHSVELADVEAALLACPGVSAAAVVVDRTRQERPRLVAYWAGTAEEPGIRSFLASRLAPPQIPARVVHLESIPLTSHGKVDRAALPGPDRGRPALGAPAVAPRNLLERQIASLWESLLDVEAVGVHDDFLELGGDSLAAMLLLTRLEEALGVEASPQWILEESTVAGLATRVLRERPGAHDPIATLREGGSGEELFWVHGDYLSGGWYCRRLAGLLDGDVGFHAIAPDGLDGRPPAPTYEEMAARHVAQLRTLRPHGPYRLGGTCNGGLVAYEMARILEREGEDVPTLALYAASAANVRHLGLRRASARALGWARRPAAERGLFRTLRRARLSLAARGAGGFARHALGRSASMPVGLLTRLRDEGASGGAVDRAAALRAHYLRADEEHVPGAYAGTVTLLWPNDESESPEEAAGWWRRVAERVDLVALDAGHQAALTDEVATLAAALSTCLAGAPTAS